MKVTIVPEDNVVLVDGEARSIDMTGMDPAVHAVQWKDTQGEIEYKNGRRNKPITDISPFQSFIDRWVAAAPPAPPPPPPPLSPRQQIINRLRADPILKAQVIESFEARGITDKQLMLDALEAKFAEPI